MPLIKSYLFGFNGQLKDNEVYGEGNCYDFGERIYDGRIGRMFSMDPLDQFVSSPFSGFANNPILHIDVEGGWVPGVTENGFIILTAEEGDNYQTLMTFLGGEENASKYIDPKIIGQTELTYTKGNFIYLNSQNQYSKAMRDVKNDPDKYTLDQSDYWSSMEKNKKNENYNCHTVISGAAGADFHNANVLDIDDRNELIREYGEQIYSPDEAEFGSTVITFGDAHTAVFFGQSQDGTAYAFSKPNPNEAPLILRVMDITGASNTNSDRNVHPIYGFVGSISTQTESTMEGYDATGEKSNKYGHKASSSGTSDLSNGSGYYNLKK